MIMESAEAGTGAQRATKIVSGLGAVRLHLRRS